MSNNVKRVNSNAILAGKNALVVGGTHGIGLGIAKRLFLQGSHVTVVGRSKESGMNAVEEIRKHVKEQQQLHQQLHRYDNTIDYDVVDVSLIKSGKQFAQQYAAKKDRLDYLIVTAGIIRIQGRVETAEGIDEKMATHYYGRLKASISLLFFLFLFFKTNSFVDILSSNHYYLF